MQSKIVIFLHFILPHLAIGQMTVQQTTIRDHVTSEQTTEVTTMDSRTTDDKVKELEKMILLMQGEIMELKDNRKIEKVHYEELQKRLVLAHSETVTMHSDLTQLVISQAEIQGKLTNLDEKVGDLQLESAQFGFIQKQLQADIGNWIDLKDNVRRSQHRLEKRLKVDIDNLNIKVNRMEKDASNIKDECHKKVEEVKNEATNIKSFFENSTIELKEFIENRTISQSNSPRTLSQRFEKLFKIYNISRPVPDKDTVFHDDVMESEFQVVNVTHNPLWNEVGSGEEGSGDIDQRETTKVWKPHSHGNYIRKEELLLELQERDLEITTLLDMYENLKTGLSVMEGRIHEIQLGNFMEKLQQSFINFSQNVLTMDQWRMASGQLINTTQVNQKQIMSLTNMIFNNSNFLRELEQKISNAQTLSYQQFTLLRIHIIQLNNTVQDMKEEWSKKQHGHGTQDLPPPVSVHRIPNGHSKGNLGTLQSRIEDIALQVVYNENRIAKLEIKLLNESLLECKKANADIYRDARINQIENSVVKISEASTVVQDILTQVQRGLYQEYTLNRNQSDVINVIIQDIGKLSRVFTEIDKVQDQIGMFNQMLPPDCYGYHRRGFHDSGVYLIRPRDTNITLEVYCDLDNGRDGWTVLQRRMDGLENFDRSWIDYQNGFGDLNKEFWLGNDFIHLLSTSNTQLKIEMTDIYNIHYTVFYDNFSIGDEDVNYRISISGFHGNTSDSFSYSDGMGFSTNDDDNDGSSSHCAMFYTAGWWYKHCHYSNLNGRFRLGMVWYNFDTDEWIQMKYTSMMIKPSIQ